ncbi:MAG: shikimate dehydrogenase [Herminiimonas sp.]|nr:shikimate dehydrogenase [Herminiimonas sp.]
MAANLPERYVVIGNPIAHSRSPDIHAQFARQCSQPIDYQRLLAPLDGFAAAVAEFIGQGGRGANVTVPFKLEAHALATRLTPRAQAAGAVNTLRFDQTEILGDNTDGAGLVADIERNAGVAIADKTVLLLGAGGAARGVVLPLLACGPAQLVIANRTRSKAAEIATHFGADGPVTASEFAHLAQRFDIVINATSASLASQLPPIPASVFDHATLAYDMMYGAQPTVFMQFATAQGATARDGLGMLVEQAAESFFLWRGVRPDTGAVLADLRRAL